MNILHEFKSGRYLQTLRRRVRRLVRHTCIFKMALSWAFQKCMFYHFFGNFFWQTFLLYDLNLQILKVVRALQQCIICHIWTSNIEFKGGGVKLPPVPQHILVFKYPSRVRVKKVKILGEWSLVSVFNLKELSDIYWSVNPEVSSLQPC